MCEWTRGSGNKNILASLPLTASTQGRVKDQSNFKTSAGTATAIATVDFHHSPETQPLSPKPAEMSTNYENSDEQGSNVDLKDNDKALDCSPHDEKSNKSILQSQQSLSVSTLGNVSRAANSILTSDETVVRRGDGAQVTSSSRVKKSDAEFDSSMDVLTKIAIGNHTPSPVHEEAKKPENINFFCCCRKQKVWV